MASDVRAIERMLKNDENVRRSVSEWIVQLARKIHERPEDIVWFFNEMKRREEWEEKLREFENMTKDVSPGELFEIALRGAESSGELKGSVEDLLLKAKEDLRKFERIKAKLKRLGVI
ncbi:hypothetical protein [Thermococcus sp.]|uniref:hypothetical protein n=1 Tax=Thermococcus sp. TaxID=35749 RepID=UPI0025F778D1|nr:hypothetical protein [Thermococcus sp.]